MALDGSATAHTDTLTVLLKRIEHVHEEVKAREDAHMRLCQETLHDVDEVMNAATAIRPKLQASVTGGDAAATTPLPHYVSAKAAAVNLQHNTKELLTRSTTDASLVTSLQEAVTSLEDRMAVERKQRRTVAAEDPSYDVAVTRMRNAVQQAYLKLGGDPVVITAEVGRWTSSYICCLARPHGRQPMLRVQVLQGHLMTKAAEMICDTTFVQ